MSSFEISKSSLLSLKAEILRKQEDLIRVKLDNNDKFKIIKKKSLELKNRGVEARQQNDLNDEEQDLLKLSKSRLESKSKLYDKLSGNVQESEELNRRYLVRFDQKNKVSDNDNLTCPEEDSEDEERQDSDYYDDEVHPSDEWVEYTDCLGRSRKCLRIDLDYLKSRDAELKLSVEKRPDKVPSILEESCENSLDNKNEVNPKKKADQNDEANEEEDMISGDMRRETLRKQWEIEEDELRNKTDIHYQNVLFSEARQHGVGYYGFSKDEDERAKQQHDLKQLRLETEKQQKKAQDLKALREKQMAARMKAARNRRRARLGLSPEEDESTPTSEPKGESEEEKNKKEEAEKPDEAEKLLMDARKRHVRPWDIGKEGVTEFYQMTQEEWNEKKRQERPTEFAPPVALKSREFSSMGGLERDIDDGDKSLRFSTKGHKENKVNKPKLKNINPYKSYDNVGNLKDYSKKSRPNKPDTRSTSLNKSDHMDDKLAENNNCGNDRLMDDYEDSDAFSFFQNKTYEPEDPTSDGEDDMLLGHYKETQVAVKLQTHIKPIPIVNEVEEIDFDDALLADYQKVMQNVIPGVADTYKSKRKGAEVAPPPTFEYFGPIEGQKVRNSGQINIAHSIDAGLKFLRNQAERKRRRPDNDL